MAEMTGIFDLTVPVVLAHPHLFEAVKFKRGGKEQGEAKYGGSFVFEADNPDLKELKARAVALAKAKWPGRDIAADFKAKQFKFPWSSGDAIVAKRVAKLQAAGKQDDHKGDFQLGKVVLKSSSKYAPRMAVIANGKIVDLDDSNRALYKNQFYFGVKVLAQLNLVPYDKVGETGLDGVTAYINLVLSTNKGERLSGGASAAEVFKGYVGSVSAEDPTAGGDSLDEEIPF